MDALALYRQGRYAEALLLAHPEGLPGETLAREL